MLFRAILAIIAFYERRLSEATFEEILSFFGEI